MLKDWLPAFLDYTSGTEAPRLMHFWSGVSAIAGCLRRKVWIDQKIFQWTPNFYIIFVARPGIVSKTTTMDQSVDMLREVPEIVIGPDTITWESLPGQLEMAATSFRFGEGYYPMSPMTLASGELGCLIDPMNRDMINFYINMWDGKKSYKKVTKTSGSDNVECPWINLIGCTTPHWLAENMPQAAVGGGFTSRCIFVYAEKKERYIAFPDEHLKPDHEAYRARLINDLEHISKNLAGPFTIDAEARLWFNKWYVNFWEVEAAEKSDPFIEGYFARKQTHLFKISMILSVSKSDSLVITKEDLQLAEVMLKQTESSFGKIFSQIGRSEDSIHAERFVYFVKRIGRVAYAEAYRYIYSHFPDFKNFEGILEGAIRSGVIRMEVIGPDPQRDLVLIYCGGEK